MAKLCRFLNFDLVEIMRRSPLPTKGFLVGTICAAFFATCFAVRSQDQLQPKRKLLNPVLPNQHQAQIGAARTNLQFQRVIEKS
jgi:hypothetical protein